MIQQLSSSFSAVMGKRRIQNVMKLRRRTVIQHFNSKRWLMVCPKVNHKTSVNILVIFYYVMAVGNEKDYKIKTKEGKKVKGKFNCQQIKEEDYCKGKLRTGEKLKDVCKRSCGQCK
mmetsp:Transcript_53567/g.61849  ORF Transcript_53567/g.61849 Transcript_53567/m.61849 type:complete len:117 (+) Transcript_53567:164-514(+)